LLPLAQLPYGFSFLVAAALAALILLNELGASTRVRGAFARLILLISALATLFTGFTLLGLGSLDVSNWLSGLLSTNTAALPRLLDQVSAAGIGGVALLSLFWVTRPAEAGTRLLLGLFVLLALAGALFPLLLTLNDQSLPRHTLLLLSLLALLLTTLLGTRIARVSEQRGLT
jgi:hypothetical protein